MNVTSDPPAQTAHVEEARDVGSERPAWVLLLVPLAAILVLRLLGRPWWCECGGTNLWVDNVFSSHNSQHLFDPYGFTHILHGFLFNAILSLLRPNWTWKGRFAGVVLFESLWEIAENSPPVISRYRSATAAFGYLGDTITNSCGDLFCCTTGFFLSRALGWKRALPLFIVTELILLWWIRDNLTLNILMLIWPIESLKAWQLTH